MSGTTITNLPPASSVDDTDVVPIVSSPASNPVTEYATRATFLAGFLRSTLSINTSAPLTGGGTLSADRTLSLPAATASANGYLKQTDWARFNARNFKSSTLITSGGTLGDYNCSGTADQAVFQTAHDSLPAAGGKLVVFPGVYYFTDRFNITKSNLEIELLPGVVIRAAAPNISNSGFRTEYTGMFHLRGNGSVSTLANVSIHGGVIDCNNQANTNALSIWGSGSDISIWTTTNIAVSDMRFLNKANTTVAPSQVMINTGNVNGFTMGRVKSVTFRDCIWDTGDWDMLSYYGDYLTDLRVLGCTFVNNQRYTIDQYGYLLNTNNNIQVHGCTFRHTKLMQGGAARADFNDDSKTGGYDFHFMNNVVDNDGDPMNVGTFATNLHSWRDVYIHFNTIVKTFTGMSFGKSLSGSAWQQDGCRNVHISFNTFDRIWTNGFDLDSTSQLKVTHNDFIEMGLTGFSSYSKHDFTQVKDNLFYNCNHLLEDVALLATLGLTTGTVPDYLKGAVELGADDRMIIAQNIIVDDRQLLDPGASVSGFN